MTDVTFEMLLVDDSKTALVDVSRALKRIGVDVGEPLFFCPANRDLPLGGCDIPGGGGLDNVDFALIDLELFPLLSPVSYTPEDLRGGTEILPFLRQVAPWLVSIGYSRLFKGQAADFLSIACGFGFDGHMSALLFGDRSALTRDLWDFILAQALLRRERSILGEDFDPRSSRTSTIQIAEDTRVHLDAQLPGWREVVHDIFHFARQITIDPIAAGFSGASVYKVFTRQSVSAQADGEWLLKLSTSPSKLQREADAHKRMLFAGAPFAKSVPLLWPNALKLGKCAGIAYHFARSTANGIELLSKGEEPRVLVERTARLLATYYVAFGRERMHLTDQARKWSPGNAILVATAAKLPATKIAQDLHILAGSGDLGGFETSELVTTAMVHGDLHFGNLMFGEDHDVLVDFAQADHGPLVVDLARLACDLLVRVPAVRGSGIPHWPDSEHPLIALVASMPTFGNLTEGDIRFFELMVRVRLACHLCYADTPAEAVEWILSQLRE